MPCSLRIPSIPAVDGEPPSGVGQSTLTMSKAAQKVAIYHGSNPYAAAQWIAGPKNDMEKSQ
jgi:hypothetical protein